MNPYWHLPDDIKANYKIMLIILQIQLQGITQLQMQTKFQSRYDLPAITPQFTFASNSHTLSRLSLSSSTEPDELDSLHGMLP